jgi:hypothetical protein
VIEALRRRAHDAGVADPDLCARAAFGVLAELSSATVYEIADDKQRGRMQRHLLAIAVAQFTG